MGSFFSDQLSYETVSMSTSVGACVFMAAFYVGSLYVWHKENRYRRNEPDVIKRRFVSVALSSLLSIGVLYALGQPGGGGGGGAAILDWIGFRLGSPLAMVKASVSSLLLTCVLFMGPIVQYVSMHWTDCNNNHRARKTTVCVLLVFLL